MPALTRNEIRTRLAAFARDWRDATRENADAKLFWARFYECYGIRPESATVYEKAVTKLDGARGFIDSFIPGLLIVEHKSRGKDLDAALAQAEDYFLALPEAERPRYIITSDFAHVRLLDLRANTSRACTLAQLPKRADWFAFLLGDAREPTEESKIDRRAAYQVSKLHQALLEARFTGHDLEVFMTRLLFCFFADDTGIFGANGQFTRLVQRSRSDGKDTGALVAELFQVLDTPRGARQSTLDEDLAAFEYINGSLFTERTRIPSFDSTLRQLLLESSELDWSGISPAIFGAMFQGVMEAAHPDESRQATRRELGAHYTSERNILRLINPLCMDDLRAELNASKRTKASLRSLYDRLPALTFFDPACGCGNFLVIAYRELRRIEMDLIAQLWGEQRGVLDVSTLCRVTVHQFYGIEIDEAAAHIARVALWITDHQMNLEAAERFGTTRPTVPLIAAPTIRCGNALATDWRDVLPPAECSYVLGNPPFVGKKEQTKSQKDDLEAVARGIQRAGSLDYVAAWYMKALAYIEGHPQIDVAFVSTNSITQGEQVGVLWPWLLGHGVHIRFTHRTFQWHNEGKGVAAVHCVIIGFGLREPAQRTLYLYPDGIKGEPVAQAAKNINPYLADAPDVALASRSTPLCQVAEISKGSEATDFGFLFLSPPERHELLAAYPVTSKWLRRALGGDELLNGEERWCLWLVDANPVEVRSVPPVMDRIEQVKRERLRSKKERTREWATSPTLFTENRQPSKRYLAIPKVSSERREYLPMDFLPSDWIASGSLLTLAGATAYEFGVLESATHMAWMRAVCGRMKSDYQYSAKIVYNNFPWPQAVADDKRCAVATAADAVLAARAAHADSTLADLYDPLVMPADLRAAHRELDKAVDAAYGYRGGKDDAARVAFLFALYRQLSAELVPDQKRGARRRGVRSGRATSPSN